MRETNNSVGRTSRKVSSRGTNRKRFHTESELYTIDNTEDIYGTNLLPNQRCYVDPWDLENYDYVRSKIHHSSSPSSFYSVSCDPISNDYGAQNYVSISPTCDYYSHYDLDCCGSPDDVVYGDNKMGMATYYRKEEDDYGFYSDDFSSSSSCNDRMKSEMSLRGLYDHWNPYASLKPQVSDCYECVFDAMPYSSLIYDSCIGGGMSSLYDRAGSYSLKSPLYDGIYSTKFGLSKKGLLQIDYSCSWNELDRVIGGNY